MLLPRFWLGVVLRFYLVCLFVMQEFYTIAWTTVEVDGNKRTNILAAAGRMREIRLLHPEQLVCYAEMKGHTEDITAMIFHQTQPTILFSGDSKVILFFITTLYISVALISLW